MSSKLSMDAVGGAALKMKKLGKEKKQGEKVTIIIIIIYIIQDFQLTFQKIVYHVDPALDNQLNNFNSFLLQDILPVELKLSFVSTL